MYFVDLGETQIVGSSPEILARLKDGKVVVRPLAGTRRRGATEEEDQALEAERSEEHTSELQSLMRISYAVFCLKKKTREKKKVKQDIIRNKATTAKASI